MYSTRLRGMLQYHSKISLPRLTERSLCTNIWDIFFIARVPSTMQCSIIISAGSLFHRSSVLLYFSQSRAGKIINIENDFISCLLESLTKDIWVVRVVLKSATNLTNHADRIWGVDVTFEEIMHWFIFTEDVVKSKKDTRLLRGLQKCIPTYRIRIVSSVHIRYISQDGKCSSVYQSYVSKIGNF